MKGNKRETGMKIYFWAKGKRRRGAEPVAQDFIPKQSFAGSSCADRNGTNKQTVFISGFSLSFFSGALPVNSTPLGTYCTINPLKRSKSSGNKMPANSLGFCWLLLPSSPRTSSHLCLLTSLAAAAVQHIRSHRLSPTHWLRFLFVPLCFNTFC